MADYIKREEAINAYNQRIVRCGLEYFESVLNQIPAADVRENRRGTWQREGSFDVCPYCESSKAVESQVGRLSMYEVHYCYFCGADMRGEKDG